MCPRNLHRTLQPPPALLTSFPVEAALLLELTHWKTVEGKEGDVRKKLKLIVWTVPSFKQQQQQPRIFKRQWY